MNNSNPTNTNQTTINQTTTRQGEQSDAKDQRPEQGHVDVHGTRLYYERMGTGRPLVFLHAGIADHHMWDTAFFAFAQEYTVIRYDLRGYGKSKVSTANGDENADEHYSHAQDLHAVLQELAVESATLVGASMGGAAAIDFALEQPAMTDALVLVGAVPSGYEFTGEVPPTLQRMVDACEQGDMDQAAELATRLWFDGPQRQPEQMDAALRQQVKAMVGAALIDNPPNFAGANAAAQPAMPRLHELTMPTLVVVGAQDDPTVQQASIQLADSIAGAERTVIDNTAHLPNLERPDEFYGVVLDFLQRTARARQQGDLPMGFDGAVARKAVAPDPEDR